MRIFRDDSRCCRRPSSVLGEIGVSPTEDLCNCQWRRIPQVKQSNSFGEKSPKCGSVCKATKRANHCVFNLVPAFPIGAWDIPRVFIWPHSGSEVVQPCP